MIVVAKNLSVLQLFISRMPKMCAILCKYVTQSARAAYLAYRVFAANCVFVANFLLVFRHKTLVFKRYVVPQ